MTEALAHLIAQGAIIIGGFAGGTFFHFIYKVGNSWFIHKTTMAKNGDLADTNDPDQVIAPHEKMKYVQYLKD